MTPRCPVKGHNHELKVVKRIVQDGTGDKASILECPGGGYRWFKLDTLPFSDTLRMRRPRWGWAQK